MNFIDVCILKLTNFSQELQFSKEYQAVKEKINNK